MSIISSCPKLKSILLGLLISSTTLLAQKDKPNVLLICVDDLRPELNCFGSEYIHSPNIDQIAAKGISFRGHYVNAPSCGPSRYTLLTGQYGPPRNNALFIRAEQIASGKQVTPSMPEWFRKQGYTTVSVGKVSHHPGGRGGKDWNDSTKIEMPKAWDRHLQPIGTWQHPRGIMHGLANGEIRVKADEMDIIQHQDGEDLIYPDGLITAEAIHQLQQLTTDANTPFFLAVGFIKPHLPFGAPQKYWDLYEEVNFPPIQHPEKPNGRSTWHPSGEFMKYNRWGKDPNLDKAFATQVRRHYAACISYADTQIGNLLAALKQSGADQNTIIILWGDHGWHLGEHAIWGKHALFEESLHSPLIISYPGMKNKGASTQAMVETLDIFPTLCTLAGIPEPTFTQGVSLTPILENPTQEGHPVIGYTAKRQTIRTLTHRLIVHEDGYTELYDHQTTARETKNIAQEHPDIVKNLTQMLHEKLKTGN